MNTVEDVAKSPLRSSSPVVDAAEDNVSIADMLRETANEFLRNKYLQGFDFNDEYQIYYNPITGYYYDQNIALFYHPMTRCYYYYDDQTDSYVYYTRIPSAHVWTDKLAERHASSLLGETYVAGMTQEEVDIFECLNLLLKNVTRRMDGVDYEVLEDEISTFIQEERMEYAPCIRIIEETNGKLHIVTISGAKIGTTSDCDIHLSSEECGESEFIAHITYNEAERKYLMMIISQEELEVLRNDERMDTNELTPIEHGDRWQFGKHRFLTHIHYGTNTCGTCEPGLLKGSQIAYESVTPSATLTVSKETLRRRNLRNMKKQYGIDDFEECPKFNYRKKERNSLDKSVKTKDDSIYACCAAKPLPGLDVASVDVRTPTVSSNTLDESNRGFGLLQRMGWKLGAGLGRKEDGITEPVITEIRPGRAGLGLKKEVDFQFRKEENIKNNILEITKQRYQNAGNSTVDDDFLV